MCSRRPDYEGVSALDYGSITCYDQWLILFRMRGAIWPSTLLTVFLSIALSLICHYLIFDHEHRSNTTLITNPTVFAFFMQTAGIVLAFSTSICYGRYWEGLSALCQMGQSIQNIVSLAFTFERDNEIINRMDSVQWKAQVLHTSSLLHATCMAHLKSDSKIPGKPLDVFGGMTLTELREIDAVDDQPALALHWLQDILAMRLKGGGMNVTNPPAVAQIWASIINFANNFAACKRVAQFPLPLPLHHVLAYSDIFVAIISPFVICAFVPNLYCSLSIVFATTMAFHGIFSVNVAMQQPFGSRTCNLPLAMLHRQILIEV